MSTSATRALFVKAEGELGIGTQSPDGERFAHTVARTGFVVSDRSGRTLFAIDRAHEENITGIAVTARGGVVTVSELDNTIRSFDHDGHLVSCVELDRPSTVAIGPDCRVYVAYAEGRLRRYDVDARGILVRD